MNVHNDFNDGLCVIYPVSTFIKLSSHHKYNIQDVMDAIGDRINSVIFYGDIKKHIENLSWINCRLIVQGYSVSYVTDMQTVHSLLSLPTTSIILKLKLIDLKNKMNKELLKTLRNDDVILYDDSPANLKTTLNMLETEARLAFSTIYISPESILKKEIYEMFGVCHAFET